MPKIADVKSRSRSKRKPLRDVSNGGFKPSFANSVMKKPNPDTKQQDPATTCGGGGDPLDRLLLAHSNLSVIIHQIDELVVQALEQKVSNKKEIESFAQVLCEIQTSLKPWVSRFKKVYSTHTTGPENQFGTTSKKIAHSTNEDTSKALESPDIYELDDFLVSPSPLVSWRADCAAEGGRNLFLLTPLPKPTTFSSTLKESSKLVFDKITNDVTIGPVAENLNNGIEVSNRVATYAKSTVEREFSSPEKMLKRNGSMVVSTPYLKMSPPKSCILLEPASACINKNVIGTKMLTVDPVGGGQFGESEPSSSQPSGYLALKYPEIFGIRPVNKRNVKKAVEASPNWCISPPKTCVLLELSDDGVIQDVETNLVKGGGIRSVVSRNEVVENTPMCKDLDTTVLRGKRAGENTLKKELWTRFEAATVNVTVDQEKTPKGRRINKGFMDLLEEVSLDDKNSSV